MESKKKNNVYLNDKDYNNELIVEKKTELFSGNKDSYKFYICPKNLKSISTIILNLTMTERVITMILTNNFVEFVISEEETELNKPKELQKKQNKFDSKQIYARILSDAFSDFYVDLSEKNSLLIKLDPNDLKSIFTSFNSNKSSFKMYMEKKSSVIKVETTDQDDILGLYCLNPLSIRPIESNVFEFDIVGKYDSIILLTKNIFQQIFEKTVKPLDIENLAVKIKPKSINMSVSQTQVSWETVLNVSDSKKNLKYDFIKHNSKEEPTYNVNIKNILLYKKIIGISNSIWLCFKTVQDKTNIGLRFNIDDGNGFIYVEFS